MAPRVSPLDLVRAEGAVNVHQQIRGAVESIRGDDWYQDVAGVEWVRLEAVRSAVDRADPAAILAVQP